MSAVSPDDDDERAALEAVARGRGTGTLGHDLVVVDTCPSTQDEARARAERGAAHGTVVVALDQASGRGRRGRVWTMLEGALACSIVLRPRLPKERVALLTQVAAAALVSALDTLALRAFVKWPNDVLLAHDVTGPLGPFRKVAGVLVEGAIKGDTIEHVIVGVGVNVRGARTIPPSLAEIAGALDEQAAGPTRARVLAVFLDALHALLDDEPERTVARALETCRARSATLGRRVRAPEDGVVGIARAIDDEGALVLALDDGRTHVVRAGDVIPSSGADPAR